MVVEIYNDHLVLLSFVMHAQSVVSNCVLQKESRLFFHDISICFLCYSNHCKNIICKSYSIYQFSLKHIIPLNSAGQICRSSFLLLLEVMVHTFKLDRVCSYADLVCK